MKRRIACAIATLLVVSCITFGPSNYIVRASGMRYTSVPLESLPLVQADSKNARILSVGHPGHYRDMTLTHGVHLQQCGSRAEFDLGGKYDEVAGTVFNPRGSGHLSIDDATTPGSQHVLARISVPGHGSKTFRIRVRGVRYLMLRTPDSCGNLDIVATLFSGSLPPTQVVPRFPTGNAGEPANSNVLFGWQPFPGAVNYDFHIWMVSQSGTAAITPSTPVTFSALVYHKTTYTWNDHGFLPGTYQYALLPLDATGKALAGWSTPVLITIAS